MMVDECGPHNTSQIVLIGDVMRNPEIMRISSSLSLRSVQEMARPHKEVRDREVERTVMDEGKVPPCHTHSASKSQTVTPGGS